MSQPIHSASMMTITALSQGFCSRWKGEPKRSASRAGSLRAIQNPAPKLIAEASAK
jgi:hypothetical protein